MRNPEDANEGLDNHGEIMDAYGDLLVGQRVQVQIVARDKLHIFTGTVWCYPKNYYLSTIMPYIPIRVDGETAQRMFERDRMEPIE